MPKKRNLKRKDGELIHEPYYYIDDKLSIIQTYDHVGIDIYRNKDYENGNYFQTKQKAQQYANKIKEMLINR